MPHADESKQQPALTGIRTMITQTVHSYAYGRARAAAIAGRAATQASAAADAARSHVQDVIRVSYAAARAAACDRDTRIV